MLVLPVLVLHRVPALVCGVAGPPSSNSVDLRTYGFSWLSWLDLMVVSAWPTCILVAPILSVFASINLAGGGIYLLLPVRGHPVAHATPLGSGRRSTISFT